MSDENELVVGSAPLDLTPEEKQRWDEIAENNSRALDAMMRGEKVEFADLTKVRKAECAVTNNLVSKIISAWDRRFMLALILLVSMSLPAEAHILAKTWYRVKLPVRLLTSQTTLSWLQTELNIGRAQSEHPIRGKLLAPLMFCEFMLRNTPDTLRTGIGAFYRGADE